LYGHPEIRITTEFLNTKLGNLSVIRMGSVEALNVYRKIMPDLSTVKCPTKVNVICRGKEMKLVIESCELPLLMRMKLSGTWKFDSVSPDEDEEYKKIGRIFIQTEDGYVKLYDKHKICDWKWSSKWGVDRGPDIISEKFEFIQHLHRYRDWIGFNRPIYQMLLHQRFFNGFNPLIRSEILARVEFSPFLTLREILKDEKSREDLIETSCYVLESLYMLGGCETKTWKNPFEKKNKEAYKWCQAYRKPRKAFPLKDGTTVFWYLKKWQREFIAFDVCED